MKWITREHVKVDRVACPWLIKKFVDKDAEFVFVPADKVMDEAKRLDAIQYDALTLPALWLPAGRGDVWATWGCGCAAGPRVTGMTE